MRNKKTFLPLSKNLIAELLGTLFLMMLLILPSAIGLFDITNPLNTNVTKVIAQIFQPFIMKGLWVGISIILVSYMFSWGSAKLNPIVTLVSMFKKDVNILSGILGILIQFLAGFGSIYFIYLIAERMDIFSSESTLGSIDLYLQYYNWSGEQILDGGFIYVNESIPSENWYIGVSFVGEFVVTMGLLFSVFGLNRRVAKYRKLFTLIVVTIVASAGNRTNNISFNPVRTLSPILGTIIFNGDSRAVDSLWIYLVPQLLAGIMYGIILRSSKQKEVVENVSNSVNYKYSQYSRKLILISNSIDEFSETNLSTLTLTTLREMSNHLKVPDFIKLDRNSLEKEISYILFLKKLEKNILKFKSLEIPNYLLIYSNEKNLNESEILKRKIFREILKTEYEKNLSIKIRNKRGIWKLH